MQGTNVTIRVGTDIGGTFTDVAILDEDSGRYDHLKILTSSAEPAKAVIECLDEAELSLEDAAYFSHGTTVAINAIIENKGGPSAIVATAGFEDLLEMRRGARTHILNPLMQKPKIFVPGRARVGVSERILWDGSVLEDLDDDELRQKVSRLAGKGIKSIALVFLHSYANPLHEERAQDLLRAEFPRLHVTASSQIVPEPLTFERTCAAALNAYCQPVVHDYVYELETQLEARGLQVALHIMQSSGSLIAATEAAQYPIRILESGPAAGSIASTEIGRQIGVSNMVTFDMGGTTAKASVIEDGAPLTTLDYELFGESDKPGSGWPIPLPVIDIVEVGSGGGSIAWIDGGGRLRVGPQSAGSDPGPACYGRGGSEPTITDAHAVLGRLSSLLGDAFPLDIDAAQTAIANIGSRLGITVEEAAAGIVEIATANASDLIREMTVSRGRDPREFFLIAYGGAGPLEAAQIVKDLEMVQVLVPPAAGTFSAFGLLVADLGVDAVRTYMTPLKGADIGTIQRLYREMEADVRAALRKQGALEADIRLNYTADLRYNGQFHDINVGGEHVPENLRDLLAMRDQFEREHLRLHTYTSPGQEVELVNLRVRGDAAVRKGSGESSVLVRGGSERPPSRRPVYFAESGGWCDSWVYERDHLSDQSQIEGPAIVTEKTSTTLVPPGFRGKIDEFFNLVLWRSTP